jgi:hypothetical protein
MFHPVLLWVSSDQGEQCHMAATWWWSLGAPLWASSQLPVQVRCLETDVDEY